MATRPHRQHDRPNPVSGRTFFLLDALQFIFFGPAPNLFQQPLTVVVVLGVWLI